MPSVDDCCAPHDDHLDRSGKREEPLRIDLRLHQIVGAVFELLLLVRLAHERLDHARRDQVFLHRAVHGVVFGKHHAEPLMPDQNKQQDRHEDQRQRAHEDKRQTHVDAKRHDGGEHHHDRRAEHHAKEHLIGVLQIVDVRRRADNKR